MAGTLRTWATLGVRLLLTSVLVTPIIRTHGGPTVTIGRDAVQRGLLDGWTNATFGDVIPEPGQELRMGGVLSKWRVYLNGTYGKVRLQIWRPTREFTKAGDTYRWFHSLVAQTEFRDVTIEGSGFHEYDIWPGRKIRLFPNDTIGFQWVTANPIPYDISMRDCSDVMATRVFDSTVANENFESNYYYQFETLMNSPTIPECRMYSIQAVIDNKECTQLVAPLSNQKKRMVYSTRAHVDDCWVVAPSGPEANVWMLLSQDLGADLSSRDNSSCVFDMLEVRHGLPTKTMFVEYSGCSIQSTGLTFESYRTPFYVHVTSSPDTTYPQSLTLIIEYKSFSRQSENHACIPIRVGLTPAYIQSPGYPVSYPSDADVCWLVQAANSNRIRIELEDSELQAAGDNCFDYVEIFDGASQKANTLARWCGLTNPGVITSSGAVVFIHFFSDRVGNFPGFRVAVFGTTNDSSTSCTRVMASGQKQFLYSNGYPHFYPDNSYACWVLVAPRGSRLLLRVHDSRLEGSLSSCPYDVAEIRDGNMSSSALLRRWCGQTYPKGDILTSGSTAFVHFTSDGSISGAGFYLSFIRVLTDACTTLAAYAFPLHLYPVAPSHDYSQCWLIQMPTKAGGVIRIRPVVPWKDSNCAQDSIEIYDAGDKKLAPMLAKWCGGQNADTVVSTSDVILVRVVTERPLSPDSFKLEYVGIVEESCQRVTVGHTQDATAWVSPPAATAPHPGATANPPGTMGSKGAVLYQPNLDVCTVIEATFGSDTFFNIDVIFTEIESPDSRGVCVHDFLEIRDGETKDAPMLRVVCGTNAPFHLRTSGRFAFFRFVTNEVNEYRGYQVRLTVNSTSEFGQCETLEAKAIDGKLISPGYPSTYPSNADICWVFKSPSKGARIQLKLVEVSVGKTCGDFLEIFDGTSGNSPLLGHVCGDKKPAEITSSGPYLYLRFVSDSSKQSRGFKIVYRTLASDTCTHLSVASWMKYIRSPGYPKPYSMTQDLCWVVTSPNGDHGVALSVLSSDMQQSELCEAEFIDVRDGPSSSSPLISRWCGHTVPRSMTTTGRSAYIRFVSNKNTTTNNRGFEIEFHLRERPIPWEKNTKLFIGLIVAICLVALSIIIASILCCCFRCCCRRKKTQSTGSSTEVMPNTITYVVPHVMHGAIAAPPYTETAVGAEAPPLETKDVLFCTNGAVAFTNTPTDSQETVNESHETTTTDYTRLT